MEEKSQDLVVKQQTRVRWCWGFLGLWDENGVGNLNIITYFLSNGLDANIIFSKKNSNGENPFSKMLNIVHQIMGLFNFNKKYFKK
jgi:hypothetical protein